MSLQESVLHAPQRVDEDAGIIYGVKVLGATSPNKYGQAVDGTDYTPEARKAAVPLYEGRQVFTDHNRQNPKAERPFRELVGVLRSARAEDSGVFADLHYYKTEPAALKVAEGAKRFPDTFGLSHNADGKNRVAGRRNLIESIREVRSVDVVTRPATTHGLFESEEQAPVSKKISEVLDGRKFADQAAVLGLLEDAGIGMDSPMPAEPAHNTHLKNAIMEVLADDSLDEAACKKKIMAILKVIKGDGGEAAPVAESVAEVATLKDQLAKSQAQVAALNRDRDIAILCESLAFKPSASQLKALTLLESADRKAFIQDTQKVAKPATGPRSNSLRSLTESRDTTTTPAPAKTAEEFAAAVIR